MTGPVVVGLDGSAASVTAAWWAAREAEALSKQRNGAQVLWHIEAELLRRYGDLDLVTELVPASAGQALPDASGNASLLVLGSRGHGSVTGFVLGSISRNGRTRPPRRRAHTMAVRGRRRHPSPLTRKLGPVAHAALHHTPCPMAVVSHN